MFARKIERVINQHFNSKSDTILVIEGARQVGKSFIIRQVGQKMFKHYVEINLADDFEGKKIFSDIHDTETFYMQVSILAKGQLGGKDDTLIFLDEIQIYPHLLTMLKFLRQDNRYTYIASGSLLGVALHQSTSIPIGSIIRKQMFPMDFEEFLCANGVSADIIQVLRDTFERRESLDESMHKTILGFFGKYLLSGGLPDAVKTFVETQNIVQMRSIQTEIHSMYGIDASKYEKEKKLKIRKIYDLVPSFMENKKKRVVLKEIEQKAQARFSYYQDEFEYLVASGITLEVRAISNPKFPLVESTVKNLLKLYLNDAGLLSNILFNQNIGAILHTENSINLGSLYECVVATELKAHGHMLYYYDNKTNGEVDYLIDDFEHLSVLPIEVKSGKNYNIHSALSRFVSVPDYHIKQGIVFSNEREIKTEGKILYLPIYHVMFL